MSNIWYSHSTPSFGSKYKRGYFYLGISQARLAICMEINNDKYCYM